VCAEAVWADFGEYIGRVWVGVSAFGRGWALVMSIYPQVTRQRRADVVAVR
jgi:hypothetical protein